MANEIHIDYACGHTVYASSAIVPPGLVSGDAGVRGLGAGGHDAGDYGVALTDKGGSRYQGDFDANIPAGRYAIQCFAQAGAAPAPSDALIDSRMIHWTGAGELTAMTILTNKTVCDKNAGSVDYYDDDHGDRHPHPPPRRDRFDLHENRELTRGPFAPTGA
jgi:hypothetical protein